MSVRKTSILSKKAVAWAADGSICPDRPKRPYCFLAVDIISLESAYTIMMRQSTTVARNAPIAEMVLRAIILFQMTISFRTWQETCRIK